MQCANIVLVGFMGTGKTSVGRRLAERQGMNFVDMDGGSEEGQKKSISSIFAEDGEPAFRAMERDLVRELAGRRSLIIAAGGGIVLNPENIRDYSAAGLVVCLYADPGTILARVAREEHRPLLEGDKKHRILQILDARRELYAAVPQQIDTTELTIDEVAEKVLSLYAKGHSAQRRRLPPGAKSKGSE
jgi:shikimate kinase